MTLPFRRRHHDHEASHDRARAIVARGFFEAIEPADAAWLEAHLAGCGECRVELDAYRADREMLRALRADAPEPPRDLWARTAASIERESGRHGHAGRPATKRTGIGRVPLGVLSGVLVVLVVVGTSLFPRAGTIPVLQTEPPGSDVPATPPQPRATPLAVTAKGLSWLQEANDGTFQLVFADIYEVCTATPEACAPLDDASTTRLTLPSEPQAVVLSPTSEQLVVVSAATGSGGSEVLVVPVPVPEPSPSASPEPTVPPTPGPVATPTSSSSTATPTAPPPTPTPAATATPTPAPTPAPTPGGTPAPGETPGSSPSPSPDPNGSRAILTGVVVVGEAAYSADGRWLAFSARQIDGAAGPDLFLWRVGDPIASAVTADHRTFFAGWLGNLVLASRVEPEEARAVAPATLGSSAATPKPGRTPAPGAATGTAAPSLDPTASPSGTAIPAEDHSVSFLLDPETGVVTDLAARDIWQPVVDAASRTIVYWSGTLTPDEAGTGWLPGTGRLVLDGWIDPSATPDSNPASSASAPPVPGAPSPVASSAARAIAPTALLDPRAIAERGIAPGPAGSPVVLAEGPLADFEASFDPTGTRLAVWIADLANADVGTLRLIALDPETGGVDPAVDPLPGVAALQGFSIGAGRLAWVTPSGQDGESSHVNVLAWTGNEFGQVRSDAAERLLVVR